MNPGVDFNATIANLEKAFGLAALQSRRAAEAARARARRGDAARQDVDRMGVHDREAASHDAKARAWEARRAEAARGYLLFGRSEARDAQFVREYSDAIEAARVAGRLANAPTVGGDAP